MKIIAKVVLVFVGAVLVCGLMNSAALFTAQRSDIFDAAKSQVTKFFKATGSVLNFGQKNYNLDVFLVESKKLGDKIVTSRIVQNLWNATINFHNDIEKQFQDSLEKMFGSDAFFLPRNIASANRNLLTGVLLGMWLILGWTTISKLSYSKFFTLMSSLFLLNAMFGPYWSFRRFFFICALVSWIMTKAAKFPVEAAGLVLVVFGLSLISKWKDKLRGKKSSEEALANTKSLMEMMQRLDQKVDDCLSKMDVIMETMEK